MFRDFRCILVGWLLWHKFNAIFHLALFASRRKLTHTFECARIKTNAHQITAQFTNRQIFKTRAKRNEILDVLLMWNICSKWTERQAPDFKSTTLRFDLTNPHLDQHYIDFMKIFSLMRDRIHRSYSHSYLKFPVFIFAFLSNWDL